MLDLCINDIIVADGSGKPLYRANVGIKNGRICAVSKERAEAKRTITATPELILAPGFIDLHAHADTCRLTDPWLKVLLYQGATTDVSGNCGFSAAPLTPRYGKAFIDSLAFFKGSMDSYIGINDFTFHEYMNVLKKLNTPMGFQTYVGHNTVRAAVMGMENRKPTIDEMAAMRDYVREAMEAGAIGLSTGLVYVPGTFADYDEVYQLIKVVAEYGGVYATHMRNQSDKILESLAASIDVCKRAGCRLIVSHFKVMGTRNAHLYKDALRMMDEARNSGLEIICDQYQYSAGATKLSSILPPYRQENGNSGMRKLLSDPDMRKRIAWEMENDHSFNNMFALGDGSGKHLLILKAPATPQYIGKRVDEIAADMHTSPQEAIFNLLQLNDFVVMPAVFYCDNELIDEILTYPYTVAGSDGGRWMPHPRSYGMFPHMYETYVREKQMLSIPEFVRKCSTMTADFLRLNKGHIAQGYDADIVVFDKNKYGIKTSYIEPVQRPHGVKYVIIGGKVVLEDDELLQSEEAL